MDRDPHERIRRRAYELWDQEGRPEGRALDHWLRAEAEVAGVRPGGAAALGAWGDQGRERAPSDLAADEAVKGGGGVGP